MDEYVSYFIEVIVTSGIYLALKWAKSLRNS